MRLYGLFVAVTTMSTFAFLAHSTLINQRGRSNWRERPNSVQVMPSVRVRGKMVGHLLVVCDKEFSDRFQQNRQKIIEYWTAYMWDVNLRFKTLTSVDIIFKISRLVIIKNTTDQPFVEETRNTNGSLLQSLEKFADWVYIHQNITDFDIALLATGVNNVSHASSYYPLAACQQEHAFTRHNSVIVLPFHSNGGNSCGLLEGALAGLLGALPDADTGPYSGCSDKNFIMQENEQRCDAQRYFFSTCTNKAIADYVKSDSASCLFTHNGADDEVLVNASSVPARPISFDDQCKIITNISSAFAEMGETPCMLGKCYTGQRGNSTFIQNLHPLDNSPCGEEKFCFRGRCLDYSYQIRNVGTKKCLHSSNRFSSNDKLVMQDCVKAPYPLDSFRILNMKEHGTFLATPYSTPDASENDDKCIGLDLNEEGLEYMKCNTEEKKWLGWDLIEVDNKRDEFLMYNRLAKGCVKTYQGLTSSGVQISEDCDESNKLMRWKFHHRKPPQGVLVKALDSLATRYALMSTLEPARVRPTGKAAIISEEVIAKESPPAFYDSYGVNEISLNRKLSFETTTSLPVSAQRNAHESSSTSWSLIVIIFLLGMVSAGIIFYGFQRHGNSLICAKSGSTFSGDKDQSMPLHETNDINL